MSVTPPICLTCGKPELEHCVFTAFILPVGCVCDAGTWINASSISPICAAYQERHSGDSYCSTCEHDKACHKEEPR